MSRFTMHACVRGRVQGVGFRHATVQQASKLGIVGWVRNLPDGSVECLITGPQQAIDDMTDWLRTGPERAGVDSLELTARELQEFDRFEQR